MTDSNGKEVLEVEVPTAREDVDQVWTASRQALSHKPPAEKEHRDAATKQADHDRNSRTNVVLAWVGTNMCVRSKCARGVYSHLRCVFPQAHDPRVHLHRLH